jgi:hypothetical protein
VKVYIISQAWEGEIRGVFARDSDANAECARINAMKNEPPASVEEHELIGVAGHRLDVLVAPVLSGSVEVVVKT